jgi:hypothetical protein
MKEYPMDDGSKIGKKKEEGFSLDGWLCMERLSDEPECRSDINRQKPP